MSASSDGLALVSGYECCRITSTNSPKGLGEQKDGVEIDLKKSEIQKVEVEMQ